jgi:hypothetical protein
VFTPDLTAKVCDVLKDVWREDKWGKCGRSGV